jgi:ABC-type phosphate transport system substrate-binding protein
MLSSIYSGQTTRWENSSGQLIQVWVLPNGDSTRIIFERVVIPSQSLTNQAMLAPDPEAMLEAISSDSNAIGYLTGSFLGSVNSTLAASVKTIRLDNTLEAALHQPVIAVTHSEPLGLMHDLLVCLQTPIP